MNKFIFYVNHLKKLILFQNIKALKYFINNNDFFFSIIGPQFSASNDQIQMEKLINPSLTCPET